jgi:hypothetical protein
MPDPELAIRAASRLTKRGGELHVAVPNGASAGLAYEQAEWFHLSWPIHFWFYDIEDLMQSLARHGFEIREVSYRMTWSPHVERWRRRSTVVGARAACWDFARLAARVCADPSRRDVLRITAVRG